MKRSDSLIPTTLYTIGHSNRSFEELIALLRDNGVKALVDVRAVPNSRRHPHFSSELLRTEINHAGIQYHWAGRQLGGARWPSPTSPHRALADDALRGYADYMDTQPFQIAAFQLINMAKRTPVIIMCAERLPQRCHRSLIADYLTLQGLHVFHLIDGDGKREHQLSPELRRESARLVYDRQTQTTIDLS